MWPLLMVIRSISVAVTWNSWFSLCEFFPGCSGFTDIQDYFTAISTFGRWLSIIDMRMISVFFVGCSSPKFLLERRAVS